MTRSTATFVHNLAHNTTEIRVPAPYTPTNIEGVNMDLHGHFTITEISSLRFAAKLTVWAKDFDILPELTREIVTDNRDIYTELMRILESVNKEFVTKSSKLIRDSANIYNTFSRVHT